jgi:hypothetical protein
MPDVLGIYDAPADVAAVVTRLRDRGYTDLETYAPAPFTEVDDAVLPKPSRVRLFTLIGGLTGVVTGYAMTIWMANDWKIMLGGKPFSSIPPYTIIAFELTILFGGLMTRSASSSEGSRVPDDPLTALASRPKTWRCAAGSGTSPRSRRARHHAKEVTLSRLSSKRVMSLQAGAFVLVTIGSTGCWEQWSDSWWPQMKWQKTAGLRASRLRDGNAAMLPPEGAVPVDAGDAPVANIEDPALIARESASDVAGFARQRPQAVHDLLRDVSRQGAMGMPGEHHDPSGAVCGRAAVATTRAQRWAHLHHDPLRAPPDAELRAHPVRGPLGHRQLTSGTWSRGRIAQRARDSV